MQSCEGCKWWKAPARDDQGVCFRFPQQVRTHKSYFCGEFCWSFIAGEQPEGIVSEAVLNLLTPEKLRDLYSRAEVDREIFDAVPDPSPAQSESETAALAPLPPKKRQRQRS